MARPHRLLLQLWLLTLVTGCSGCTQTRQGDMYYRAQWEHRDAAHAVHCYKMDAIMAASRGVMLSNTCIPKRIAEAYHGLCQRRGTVPVTKIDAADGSHTTTLG